MLSTIVMNLRDHNEKEVALPCSFENVRTLFEEQFGFCNARSEEDFECLGLHNDVYPNDGCCCSLGMVNDMALSLQHCESEFTERELKAFFERYSYADLIMIVDGSVAIYNSKEEYLCSIYEMYGLTDTKFLWTTVDAFLDDDYVFSEIEINGDVYQATNGCVVETF